MCGIQVLKHGIIVNLRRGALGVCHTSSAGRRHGAWSECRRRVQLPRVCRVHTSAGRCADRCRLFFFFNDTATTEIYTLSLHDALPISSVVISTLLWARLSSFYIWVIIAA